MMDFNFNTTKGMRKMLKLIVKYKQARIYMWAFLIMSFIFGMTWVLPPFINAIKWW